MTGLSQSDVINFLQRKHQREMNLWAELSPFPFQTSSSRTKRERELEDVCLGVFVDEKNDCCVLLIVLSLFFFTLNYYIS